MDYGAEGNINGPIKPAPVSMPEYNDLIEATLLARLKPGYIANIQEEGRAEPTSDADILTFIKDTLIECEALVAGGFLLGTIHNYDKENNRDDPKLDMDFYVPCRNLVKFNKIFAKLIDANSVSQHNATFYCRSFLRRNGIRSVQTFYSAPKTVVYQPARGRHPAIEREVTEPLIDIMAVRNARSPLDVVQNFDLSFCQLWYDGKGVWATHPQDVKTKSGVLQGDYTKLLIETQNQFLRKRMDKYKRRGFTIRYDANVLRTIDEIKIERGVTCRQFFEDTPVNGTYRIEKTYYNRWMARLVLHSLLYTKYQVGGGWLYSHDRNNDTRGKPFLYRKVYGDNYYRIITDKKEPLDTMQVINVADGYDTDDYDITQPTKFYPELNRIAVNLPAEIQEAWIAQPDELKFYKVLNIILTNFGSTDLSKTALGNRLRKMVDKYRARGIPEDDINSSIEFYVRDFMSNTDSYVGTLKNFAKRNGTDMVTLDDDVPVYDLHLHTADEAIGVDGLKNYLNPLITQRDKSHLPCYVTGCTMILTLDEIRAIVDYDYYSHFTEPIPEPLPPPDPLLGDFLSSEGEDGPGGDVQIITRKLGTEMIKNGPTKTDGWGHLFHWIMCPFCLEYINRHRGCTYVAHQDDKVGTSMPYCKPQNIVKEVLDKYVNAGYNGFEICIQCGRPCFHHQHFDLNDPPGLIPMPRTARGDGDYVKCSGGGRREALARMIAVRKTVKENPGMEPIALRRLAGLAAEAGASNEAFLTQADTILAKDVGARVNANLNMPAEGGRRVGAVCPHGYENYREKIPKTRKHSQKKQKRTRKSKTN
jgi:hypothetical protein